jgi:glycosyltransferase involved in cell wall biosynthesis
MKVLFVTPRYGPEVMGGAESAARLLAEHLALDVRFEVAAYSTCALDDRTWANELPAGDSVMNGVALSRFEVPATRQPSFFTLDKQLRRAPRQVSLAQSQRWLELNGPHVPRLVSAAADGDADVAVFSPYLFWPTVAGIQAAPMPTVLHPAAHDEPPLYFPAIGDAFVATEALCYYTAAERRVVQARYRVAEKPQIVLGIGVDDPTEGGRAGRDILGLGERPYLVSLGRVDDQKGSAMLDAFFRRYKQRRPGPLALALVGPVASTIEPHPDVVVTGAVDEPTKWDLLRDAMAAVSPSALESFSIVIMEAWEQSLPVVVNALCEPTRDHCLRSGGGLWFGSYRQFEVVVDRLWADADLRRRLGANGKAYVDEHYRWPALTARYARFLELVVERGPAAAI